MVLKEGEEEGLNPWVLPCPHPKGGREGGLETEQAPEEREVVHGQGGREGGRGGGGREEEGGAEAKGEDGGGFLV